MRNLLDLITRNVKIDYAHTRQYGYQKSMDGDSYSVYGYSGAWESSAALPWIDYIMLNSAKITVSALAQMTESRDRSTGEHVSRIAKSARLLTDKLLAKGVYAEELSSEIVDSISLSATLHDIGKISIPDEVLLKPDKLSAQEFQVIKRHSMIGAWVIEDIMRRSGEHVAYLSVGREIALYHHERWDGEGYPRGLSGTDIPISARITAVVDVFDALTHSRCYKSSFSHGKACDIIAGERGKAFDPIISELFLSEVADAL